MKLYVVPEPSERQTGVIFVLGRLTPGLIFLIAALSHWVMFPR